MHDIKKRLLSILITAAVLAALFLRAKALPETQPVIEEEAGSEEEAVYDKETVYLWYTDDALTNYLNSAAVEYNEIHGTRVMPVLKPGLDFLEAVNAASVKSSVPDLYIISHDALERAYLAGLAQSLVSLSEESTELERFKENYLSTSLDAVAYRDRLLAYPFYFDTTGLLYNRSYIRDMASSRMDQQEGTAPDADAVEEAADLLLPETMGDITALADGYDAPENVESFFKWDVTDIFYNYFFLGDAIDMGGKSGWDKSKFNIYNENAIRALEEYQSLNQFFSIDTGSSDYDAVMKDFIEGKIVFTIATTDAVEKLESAKEEGTFPYDYGVTFVPDLSDEQITRSLSITSCMVVNPFSGHPDTANDFASFATVDHADSLYRSAKKVSAARGMDYGNDALSMYAKEYDYSIPLPKMIEMSNLWVQLEGLFSRIWDGEDANEALKTLAEKITAQVTGKKEELPKIEIQKEEEETEYLDEEALRQEALAEDGQEDTGGKDAATEEE
ncbi:MAG: sugar ABC transporter substrate-binding protein [Lachnospiraceae bacterium]|nr:sugar ABC transporter substrate-binding protein [Lachnospiraceae bacterium]